MKALITGAGGQLARQLVATAPTGVDLKALSRSECDITDAAAVERVFNSFLPDVVINPAAFTSVDAAEDAPGLAFLVNAEGAKNVAAVSERVSARLIQISTDYVFDGNRSSPYPPDAPTNPLNVYGASKLEGERLALAATPSALVIRVGWLYSQTGKNFLSTMLRPLNPARPLKVVRDQVGCPTSAREFAAAIWRASEVELRGIYHWANLGEASWYDFAMECLRVARELRPRDLVPEIVAVTSEELETRAKRPRYSVLDPTRLAQSLRISPTPWREAVRAELI